MNRIRRWPWLGFLLLLLLLLAACGPKRRGEPFSRLQLSEAEERGRRLYAAHCDECHPGGAAGVGPALNNKPLPRWLMHLQIRRGFGAMPGFSERQIADEEVERILDYLKALRERG